VKPPLRDACMSLVVIYGPYLSLFFVAEEKMVLFEIWPLFPGLAIVGLIQPFPFLAWINGMSGALLLTPLFVGCSILAVVLSRRRWIVWTLLAGTAIISAGLVWVILLLLRA
jgi:hypothetical protein